WIFQVYSHIRALREILSVKVPDLTPSLGITSIAKLYLAGAEFHRSEVFTLFLAGANALRLLAHKNV
ncbi:hypothetical protein ACT3RM_17775, partial [Pseudoalteromonas sp. AOP7-A1-14]|uniref:hypothetical protein n=1 Tax=Pseudoalteromonas sp. AOP7-A1-14 TaxID=3457648 RepID=UPI00402B91F9